MTRGCSSSAPGSAISSCSGHERHRDHHDGHRAAGELRANDYLVLAASLAQAGAAKAQVSVQGEGMQVDAKGVPLGAWMDWLDRMRRDHRVHSDNRMRRDNRVRVTSAYAGADGEPGMTTVSALLQPQPGL
ncbi:type II secretion system protein M [Burkholderia sp. JSH-S8]|nr:type II secretion system protein M [Burkholderia sp. JSH-S8]